MKIIKNLLKKLNLQPKISIIDVLPPLEYIPVALRFFQRVDFCNSLIQFSCQAKKLLQYLLGAFNHYREEELFKSYQDIYKDTGMTRYGIDKARQELEKAGLITRITKSYKNKSHWSINFIQFFALNLKLYSKKLTLILLTIINKFSRSANSYNTSNNINNINILIHTIYRELNNFCSIKDIFNFIYEKYKIYYSKLVLEPRNHRVQFNQTPQKFIPRPRQHANKNGYQWANSFQKPLQEPKIKSRDEIFVDDWKRESNFIPKIQLARTGCRPVTIELVPDWLKPLAIEILRIQGGLY